NPAQLHRFEGILIYFGFLLLLFIVSEKIALKKSSNLFQQAYFPLLVYYAITLAIPLVNSAYHQQYDFWEHSLFVLLIPLVLTLPLVTFRFYRKAALWFDEKLAASRLAKIKS
ncbi:MAG: hypothetical protein AB1489_42875, partial [Acidobacteriota bacterium]